MSNFYKKLRVSAILLAASFVFLACTSDYDKAQTIDVRLVNAVADEAWIDDYPIGRRDGFILRANGTFSWISDSDKIWAVNFSGTWTTSENSFLTLNTRGGSDRIVYNISSNGDLILGKDWTFLRTSDVVIGQKTGQ